MGGDHHGNGQRSGAGPNKIRGGNPRAPSRGAFWGRGAAVLGNFPARIALHRAGSTDLSIGRAAGWHFKGNQWVSRSAAHVVAWLASHGRGQGVENAAESARCRLMDDLTNGLASRGGRSGAGGLPPFRSSLVSTSVASAGAGDFQKPTRKAGRAACLSKGWGRKIFNDQMGSGVWTARTRKTRLAAKAGGSMRHGTDRVRVHPWLSGERRVERKRAGYAGGRACVN